MKRLLNLIRVAVFGGLVSAPVFAQGVYDEWDKVVPPAPPALVSVNIDPATTALLVLDVAKQTCNQQQRPRCIAMLPKVEKMLSFARQKGLFVVYTLGAASNTADILPPAAMLGGEPVVKSGPDKFVNTDLDNILRAKGIKTVISIGAAAHGAVLYTSSGAAARGYEVLVPVDLMASEIPYAEQYTAWQLVNAPRIGDHIKLTRLENIH